MSRLEEALFEGLLRARRELEEEEFRRKRFNVQKIVWDALCKLVRELPKSKLDDMLSEADRFALEYLCQEMIRRSEATYGGQFDLKPTDDPGTQIKVLGIHEF